VMRSPRAPGTVEPLPPLSASADTASRGFASFLALFKPQVLRGLKLALLWSLGLGLFLRVLELIVVPDAHTHMGLLANVLATLIISLSTQAVLHAGWLALGYGFWLRSPAARDRHARDGVYAITPLPISLSWLVVAMLVGTFAGYHLWMLVARWGSIRLPAPYAATGLRMALLLATFSTLVLGVIDSLVVRAGHERSRAEAVQRQLAQAQLYRLQAQLEPHMLFNTLANLHALIDTQPRVAQDMLSHLIRYLRATLMASRAPAITLGEEMAQVQDYLQLMQIRMGERLRVAVDVPAELASVRLPPMLVQPLVENALKHGLDPLPEGGTLRVSARLKEGCLEIEVLDDGLGLRPSPEAAWAPEAPSPGFGLRCIRERLQTCYGAGAELTLRAAAESDQSVALEALGARGSRSGTVATLRIPCTLLDVSLTAARA
jgi:two-component sensor histidine kinase